VFVDKPMLARRNRQERAGTDGLHER
jgi:hypothetical protein